jgi:hypothetical protein
VKKNWAFDEDKALGETEVHYWNSFLRKVLKFGLELEFNLSETKQGACGGDPDHVVILDNKNKTEQCPCINKKRFGCENRCVVDHICQTIPNRTKCEKHKNGTCLAKDWPECPEDCDRWEWSCIGTTCIDFEAPCNHGCIYFQKECTSCPEYAYNQNNPESIRKNSIEAFKPINSHHSLSESGVLKITKDGSLLGDGGIEVITNGRRFNYYSFLKMNKEIMDFCKAQGAYTNSRCSFHIHALASYFPDIITAEEGKVYSELEKPMPDVILGNIFQLYRRFSAALVWMTSALQDGYDHFTRWEKFRVSILPFSPMNIPMSNLVTHIKETVPCHANQNGKYTMLNLNWNSFSKEDPRYLDTFHLEFRIADGIMSPTTAASWVALHWAIILKAVKLSRYGLLEAFDTQSLHMAEMVLDSLLNTKEPWNLTYRVSNTGEFFKNGYDSLVREESFQLLKILRKDLIACGDAYEVLCSLAEKPLSIRLIEGQTWEQIEDSLSRNNTQTDELDKKIEMVIDLGLINKEYLSEGEYIEAMFEVFDKRIKKEHIKNSMKKLQSRNQVYWDSSLGAFVKND